MHYTQDFRQLLTNTLRGLNCTSILDAPCGDYNWMKAVDLEGITYQGADIVPDLITQCQTNYPGVSFQVLDITTDPLPKADFWLCRDVLFHLSNEDIAKIIDNFKNSDITYFGSSHFPQASINPDAESDPLTYRFINLTKSPFNLPEPIKVIKDSIRGFPDRWLGIWEKSQF